MTRSRLLLPLLASLLAAGCTLLNDPSDLDPGPDTTAPPAPAGLTAIPGITQIELQWTAVDAWDLDHYEVYSALTTQPLAKVGESATASFTVTSLDNLQLYDFMVQAVDRFGNGSLSSDVVSAQPDGVGPTVTYAFNPGPQSGANLMTDIIFTFDEPMDTASVEANAVVTSDNPVPPDCSWTWFSDNTEAKCDLVIGGNPSQPFENSTTCAVTLNAGATDRAGNALVGTPVVASFTTAGAPDEDPPGVTSVTVSNYQSGSTLLGAPPALGAQGVFPETNVVITFDEAMDTVATGGAVSVLGGVGYNGGTKTWNAAGTVLTFNPDVSYPHGTTVSVQVATGAQDVSGINLLASDNRTFKIALLSFAVTFASEPAIDGYSYVTSGGTATYVYPALGDTALVGDSASKGQYKGYVSFLRSGLSVNLTRFTAASLYAYQNAVSLGGTPYADLDYSYICGIILGGGYKYCDRDLWAVHVNLGTSLDAADVTSAALSGPYELSTSESLGAKSVDVLAAVESDRTAARSRTQFRVEFPVFSDNDAIADYASFYTGEYATAAYRPRLVVYYEYY
jgi:hypothetical protein